MKWNGGFESVSMTKFLTVDMNRKYIRKISIPALKDHQVGTYCCIYFRTQARAPKRDLNVLWKGSLAAAPARRAQPQWFIRTFKVK